MEFKLQDVVGWHCEVKCVPTTLCAITGMSPAEAAKLLSRSAIYFDEVVPPTLQKYYRPTLWKKAIECAGGTLQRVLDGDGEKFDELPTIDEYMGMCLNDGLTLVFCVQEKGEAHLFAADGNNVVDCYTDGKKQLFTPVRDELKCFRVMRTCKVLKARSSSEARAKI